MVAWPLLDSPLGQFLALQVPLQIATWQRGGLTAVEAVALIRDRHPDFAEILGTDGDVLIYGTRPGASLSFGAMAARLAEVLAAMAFLPGGVTAFGSHWEAPPPPTSEGLP